MNVVTGLDGQTVKYDEKPIGIGRRLAATPSHTTVRMGHAYGGSAGLARRSRPGRNRPSEMK